MHNTLCVDGKDQAAVAGRFLWSRRYTSRVLPECRFKLERAQPTDNRVSNLAVRNA